MAKIKIDDVKLEQLRDYFLNGGSSDAVDIMEHLETEDEAVVNAYVAALRKKYPADFDPDYKEPEPEVEEKEEFQFFYDNGDGLLVELEQVRSKNNKIYFKKLEPKELVDLIVRGQTVTVDLVQLAKKSPGATEHGVRVDQLIQLAKLAQG